MDATLKITYLANDYKAIRENLRGGSWPTPLEPPLYVLNKFILIPTRFCHITILDFILFYGIILRLLILYVTIISGSVYYESDLSL